MRDRAIVSMMTPYTEFALERERAARSPAATLIAADPTTRGDPGTLPRTLRPRPYPLPNQKRNQIV